MLARMTMGSCQGFAIEEGRENMGNCLGNESVGLIIWMNAVKKEHGIAAKLKRQPNPQWSSKRGCKATDRDSAEIRRGHPCTGCFLRPERD
jgi:hypothetical protein